MNDIQKQILQCVRQHDIAALDKLLKANKGVDLHFSDAKGRTLLHYAASLISGQCAATMQKLLLDCALEPRRVDESFRTPEDYALKINNTVALTMLRQYQHKREQQEKEYVTG